MNVAYLCVTGPPQVTVAAADNEGGTKVDDYEGGDKIDSADERKPDSNSSDEGEADSGSSAMSKLIAIAFSFLTAAIAAT